MLSKTGHFISGSYEGTLRVFRIGPDAAECEEVFDTQSVTGKADFSRNDGSLVYVSRVDNPLTGTAVDGDVDRILDGLMKRFLENAIQGFTGEPGLS